jgi:hypothetical protein
MPTNPILKRRSLIKQLGAAAFLATPVFRAVISEAQTSFPLRLVLLNLPGGIQWRPGGGGLDTSFDTMYAPFAQFQSDSIVFDDINNRAGDLVAGFWELEGHGGGCRSMFGGAVRDQGCGGSNPCGPEIVDGQHWPDAYHYGTATTIDQLLGQQIGHRTPFDSVLVGTLWDRGQGGDHAECNYLNGKAVRPMSNPMSAYERLFGAGLPSAAPPPEPGQEPQGPDPAMVALYQRGKSRLDFLTAEVTAVKAIAGMDEQAKLDQHLTSLRELERRLPDVGGVGGAGLETKPGAGCALPGGNASTTDATDMRAVSTAFNEIGYQTLNCDLSRILVMQWLSSGDHIPRFQFMDLRSDHHGMEHSETGSEYRQAQLWIFAEMAKFIKMLKDTPEGDGNMLDNSIVYLASEMGNGGHTLSPALSAIFGKGGGAFRTGRRVSMGGRNINDVLTTVVRTMGVNVPYVGDPEFNGTPADLG